MTKIDLLILTSNAKERLPKPGDIRHKPILIGHRLSKVVLTCVSYGDGYVTAREASCYPTIYTLRAWQQLLK